MNSGFVLPMSRIPTIEEFLTILGITPAGFAGELFSAVYRQLFDWSTDLRAEYERYYCVEYATFAAYLENANDIVLDQSELEKKHILRVDSLGGLLDDAYEDNILEEVLDSLRKFEGTNED